MAKTAIVSPLRKSDISRGDDPPYPPMSALERGRRRGSGISRGAAPAPSDVRAGARTEAGSGGIVGLPDPGNQVSGGTTSGVTGAGLVA
jgi:hypothetical protein